ncbi:mucin-12-like [Crassostrea angulata]|uniref:mucin-12-like n=1 Tax=Magallana angulata TaxID=2784310 RepID=UPI0022B0F072|nr:mucin-12-like [Crassostrea angulata]
MDLDSSTHAGGIVYGTMTVVGHELGLKRICLDSVANPRTSRIEDEICFQINVTTGDILEPDETNPYFVNPTLPTSTVLQCVVNQQCYLNLWARNRVGVEKCPQLEVDKTIEDGVYIFPLRDSTNQPCVFESVILIDNVTDLQLCFSLSLDSSSENIANAQKDTRCYIIRVLPKVTVKGSCAGMSCYNEGFCDGSSPSSQCLCRSGFSDYNCSKDFGIAQAFNSCTSSQAIFGDVALPKLIRCPLLENCDIPFSVTDTSNLNSFNVTWNGTNFDSVNISLSQMSGSRDFTGNAVVVHNATGKHEFCLTLGIRGYVYDSVCCFILTEPDIVPQLPDNGQSLFISPSPSNNSEFSCTAGQPCHVIFRTSKGDDQNCPELHDRSRMSVHIFTALSPNECQRDVLIESQNSTQGTVKYCFQTSSSGILGEVRCMTIHFENHGLPPPPPTTTTTTTESPTTVIPSTTTTPSATSDNDHTTTSDNDHTTTSNTVSTSLPGNGPESATNKEISTRQTEQLASKETTLILGSVQTITTLGTAQTTQIQPEQTIIALETGSQATTLLTVETTTITLAAGQTTTTLGAGQTTTTLAAGQISTLGSDQTKTTLAAEQTTQTTIPAAGETTTTLAAGQTTTLAAERTTQTTMPAAGETTTTLAAGQTTTLAAGQISTLGSDQTKTTLAAEQTTQTTIPAAGETTTTPAAGQPSTTLAAGQTTTTFATEQTTQTTMPAAGETTTTLAAGQTTTLAAGQTTMLAAEQTTQKTMPAAGQTTSTLAAGQTTTTMPAAGETTRTLAAGQTTTLAAGQTTMLAAEQTTQKTMPAAGQTTSTLAAGQTTTTMPAAGDTTTTLASGQTTTTFATGRTVTTMQNKRETCDVVDVQEWAKKGRVKCECFHPTGGTTTTVIAKNPHVSGKSLMVAAGLGSGAMVTMLGTGVLLYAVSQKYFGPRKTGPGSDTNQQKKKLSVASCPDKKQLQ